MRDLSEEEAEEGGGGCGRLDLSMTMAEEVGRRVLGEVVGDWDLGSEGGVGKGC